MKKTNQTRASAWVLKLLPLFSAVLFILAGCVPSIHPLYRPENLSFNEELLGNWSEKEEDGAWQFSRRDATSYHLVIQDGEKPSKMICRLVKIKDRFFLDVSPDPDAVQQYKLDVWTAAALVPGHLVMKVETVNPLKIGILKGDWVKTLVEKDPAAIAHVKLEPHGNLALTATTDDLQKFLLKHWATAEAWDMGEMKKRN